MSKNRMSSVGVTALVAVALGSSLLLTACKASSSTAPGPGSTSGTATSSVAASGLAGQLGETTTGTLSATATANGANGSSAGGGNAPTITNGTFKPFPPLPESKLPAITPNSPAAPGATLAPLKSAPNPTIVALESGTTPEGAQYKITMRPYGIGPDIIFGSRIAIRVDSATPIKSAPKNDKIEDANLLVVANTNDGGDVTKGGSYTAVLTFRSDGEKMLPILSLARLEK